MQYPTTFFGIVMLFTLQCGVRAEGKNEGFLAGSSVEHWGEDLRLAMDEVMGCGSDGYSKEHMANIKRSILPMWRTMPKNSNGKLDWKSLRYVCHRYFMKKASLLIKGMEPTRQLNTTDFGTADILEKHVPDHVDMMFGDHRASQGYSLEDGIALLAAIERLIVDSESHLLEQVYARDQLHVSSHLDRDEMQRVLENYMVHWMIGNDEEGLDILMSNRSLLEAAFPHWEALSGFVDGKLRSLHFLKARHPKEGAATALFDGKYLFSDAHEIVGDITMSFQSFWQSECSTMKNQLVAMDHDYNGRVRLSDFYGTGLDEDWRFGESEAYLRELGVLDESSSWQGKQVIIANYLQAASNCIVATDHYLVCCKNECEAYLDDIEAQIGNPVADSDKILITVGNLSSLSDDAGSPSITNDLVTQLNLISEMHGGTIPLHGRLFAQWLHYVFPRECPFPLKTGALAQHTLTPLDFGDTYIASIDEMSEHISKSEKSEDQFVEEILTQWSHEEELFADYSQQLHRSYENSRRSFASKILYCGAVALLILLGLRGHIFSNGKCLRANGSHECQKDHFV